MHGRFVPPLIAALILPGCVQATRHSNTMVFGTNTQFGIRAGTSAASVPEVNVGYSRQEVVIMPLVANGSDDGHVQKPCDIKGGSDVAPNPCLLVGTNDKAQDSYSVLASFGSKYGAGADAGGAKAEGAIAQYFATGVAAQLLALQGGASVVATGEAAKKAAETKSANEATIAALYGGEANIKSAIEVRKTYDEFVVALADKIKRTKAENLPDRIKAFETATGTTGTRMPVHCTAVDACISALRRTTPYLSSYEGNEKKFADALAAWTTDL